MRFLGRFAGPAAALGIAMLTGSVWAKGETQAKAVAVGDGVVNATKLTPYNNAFAVTYEVANGEKISTGIWSDQLQLREEGGRRVWVRTQSMASFNGLVLTSVNTFDPATFAPISTILKNRDGTREYWTFRGNTAKGHVLSADGHDTLKTVVATKPAFDFNCCMASLIPAGLPLAAGKSFALPGIPAKGGAPDVYPFYVRGRERIKAGFLSVVDAWAVEFRPPGSGTVTFWITDNPRRLVGERLVGFPSKTCTSPDEAEHAVCPAQGESAGRQYDQTFEMLGSR